MNEPKMEQLIQRIEFLEKKVERLERMVAARRTRTNGTVSEKMTLGCYQAAKKAFEDDSCILTRLADDVSRKYSMKKSTALLTIEGAYALLRGELFKSAISGKAATLFLDEIEKDYGASQMQKSILALRLHIQHRRSAGHNVDLLESICNKRG